MNDIVQASEEPRDRLTSQLLTPQGIGAIAVVRVQGAEAWSVIRQRVRGRAGMLPMTPQVGRLYYGTIADGADAIDEVIATCLRYEAGGLAVVDISCHGGVRGVERVLAILAPGEAEDGPGGEDAESGGPGDLDVGSEARRLLQSVTTARGVLFLLAQTRLLSAELARVAALAESEGRRAAEAVLRNLLSRSRGAHLLVEGAEAAVVGPVNSGKSAVVNCLAGRLGSVVSDRPGTTRDWVTVDAAIAGVGVRLIDTAGLRASPDALEQEAIGRCAVRARAADMIMVVVDGSRTAGEEAVRYWSAEARGRPAILVTNKSDLGRCLPAGVWSAWGGAVQEVSAATGAGIGELRRLILDKMGVNPDWDAKPTVFSRNLANRLESLSEDRRLDDVAWGAALRGLAAGSGAVRGWRSGSDPGV